MSAVPNLVLDVERFCLMYETPYILDPWIELLVVSHQEWITRIESGIQDCYSYRLERARPGFDSVKRVDMVINRGQKIVHPCLRQSRTGRSSVRKSLATIGENLTLVQSWSDGLHQKSTGFLLKVPRDVGRFEVPEEVELAFVEMRSLETGCRRLNERDLPVLLCLLPRNRSCLFVGGQLLGRLDPSRVHSPGNRGNPNPLIEDATT